MTDRENALRVLKEAQRSTDTEYAHIAADKALCDLLMSLGYQDVVEEYYEVDKWFS